MQRKKPSDNIFQTKATIYSEILPNSKFLPNFPSKSSKLLNFRMDCGFGFVDIDTVFFGLGW